MQIRSCLVPLYNKFFASSVVTGHCMPSSTAHICPHQRNNDLIGTSGLMVALNVLSQITAAINQLEFAHMGGRRGERERHTEK